MSQNSKARKSPLSQAARPKEPAALMKRPSRAKRNRDWEKRNRAFSYRIDPELNEAMNEVVAAYRASGFITTVSDVAEAWLRAGREQWEKGNVSVAGKKVPEPDHQAKPGIDAGGK